MSEPVLSKTAESVKPNPDFVGTDTGNYLMPVPLRPSRYLFWGQAAVLVSMAVASALALWPHIQPQPLWALVLGLFWILVLLAAYGLWYGHKHGPSQLSYREGDWYLVLDGVEFRAALVGDLVIHSWLLVARFRLPASGARINVICLPDSTRAEDFRRLRVWLRIYLWHLKR